MKKRGNFFFFSNNQGFGLIEATISIGIATIFIVAFTSLVLQALKTAHTNTNELKATMYLQELVEVTKDLEQSDWPYIAGSSCYTPSVCHPDIQSNKWILSSGEEQLDDGFYTRSLTLEQEPDVNPHTKKIIAHAQIEWDDGSQHRTSQLESYLYNYNP